MTTEGQTLNQALNVIECGARVILTDGQRGTVEASGVRNGELRYQVRIDDGTLRDVEAGNVIRAQVFAKWVAPDSDWNGEERRKGERRKTNGHSTPGDGAERRQKDRRRP